jgi:hypothetical protein
MGDAKITAGVTLKFLGKQTYPENTLSLQHPRINFRYGTLPRFFVFTAKSHMRILPDYRIFRVTVRATEIYKIWNANSPHFLALFASSISIRPSETLTFYWRI